MNIADINLNCGGENLKIAYPCLFMVWLVEYGGMGYSVLTVFEKAKTAKGENINP